MTMMQEQLRKAGLSPSQDAANDISRKDAKIVKPKWMEKADKKFKN
jgi:hypothetical protein